MRYVVDRMTMADIPRVIEIEKLAYPSPWPSSAYRKELQENRYAHYVVVRDTHLQARIQQPPHPAHNERADVPRRVFPLNLLPTKPAPPTAPDTASIVGFAGLWLMVDESHITTIAVHPDYRGHGIGEALLSALIGISYDIGARMVTLEVRVSNAVAQNLYHKYGFKEAGVRRRYYSDNHEDAYIMWTDEITSHPYREQYLRLRSALAARMESADEHVDAARQQTPAGE
ncbi:MAG: ribosomal protein S18-alanine N-acetyltransferase [Ktedonobacterales bacterium]